MGRRGPPGGGFGRSVAGVVSSRVKEFCKAQWLAIGRVRFTPSSLRRSRVQMRAGSVTGDAFAIATVSSSISTYKNLLGG